MLRSYFKNAGILGLTEILLRLKGLVLLPILTKHFGSVNYGIWAQVGILVGVLSPLMTMGMESALLRFLPGASAQEKRQGLASLLGYTAFVSIIVSLWLWGLDRLLAEAFFESPQNAQYVSLCGFVIATSLVLNIIRNWYRVEDRAEIYATINILQSGMGMVLGIAVAAAKSSVYNLVLLTTLFEAILSLVSLVCIFRRYGIGSPSWHVLKRYAGYGLPLMPAGYAMWILNASDRIFIVHYGNLSDLGVYSAVYSLGYVFISVCFNPIWTMYPARAAELYNTGELEDLNSLFRYSTKTALALLVPIMAGFAVLANPVVHVFSTDEFVRGASLVPIITLGYVFHMMGSYWEISLWLAKRPGLATVNILWASASNILLNFLLVPTWGITGAALATAFSFAIQMLLNVWRGSSCVRLRFDWPFLGKVMLSAGFMALAVRQFQSESIPVLLGSVVAGAGIYAAGLIALRSFSATEGQALLGLLHMQWTARYRLVRLLVGIR